MATTKIEFTNTTNPSNTNNYLISTQTVTLINRGVYFGIGGSSIGITGGRDGVTVSVGGQISIGPTASGSTTINWNDGQVSIGGQFGVGVGTPTGLPGISL